MDPNIIEVDDDPSNSNYAHQSDSNNNYDNNYHGKNNSDNDNYDDPVSPGNYPVMESVKEGKKSHYYNKSIDESIYHMKAENYNKIHYV